MFINPDIFHTKPQIAFAFAGFCDGKLGNKPNPPQLYKGKYISVYMSEFNAGRRVSVVGANTAMTGKPDDQQSASLPPIAGMGGT